METCILQSCSLPCHRLTSKQKPQIFFVQSLLGKLECITLDGVLQRVPAYQETPPSRGVANAHATGGEVKLSGVSSVLPPSHQIFSLPYSSFLPSFLPSQYNHLDQLPLSHLTLKLQFQWTSAIIESSLRSIRQLFEHIALIDLFIYSSHLSN